MQVSEMMSRDVQLTAPTENLLTTARTMAQFDVGALPVGEEGRSSAWSPIGISWSAALALVAIRQLRRYARS